MNRLIIGIAGKAGAGKDTLADELVKNHGFRKASFALPLKLEGMRLMGFTSAEVFDSKPPHVRKWLQEYGVSKREEDLNYWVDKLRDYTADWSHIVVPDVRFPNEVEAVRSWGGAVVRVCHAGRPYALAGTDAAKHPSETALDGVGLPCVPNPYGMVPADMARIALLHLNNLSR